MKRQKFFIILGTLLVVAAVVALICVSCHNTNVDDPNPDTTDASSITIIPDTTAHVHEFTNPENIIIGTEMECIGTKRTCSCGQVEVTAVSEHVYSADEPEVIYKDGKAIGYKIQYTCEACGYSYERLLSDAEIELYQLDPISKLNHSHVWESNEIEVTEEDYEAYLLANERVDNTTVPEGYVSRFFKVTRSCECGESETLVERRVEPAPHTEPIETDVQIIPEPTPGDTECDHVYRATVTQPTCTSGGFTEYVCEKCGKSYTADLTEALGHKYGNWAQTTAATCEHTGLKTRTCSRCGETETQVIAKTTHIFGDWIVTKAATCGQAGTKTRTCKTCGKTETQTIEKLSHSYGSWTTTRQPSCEVNGEQSRTCTKCGNVETKAIAAVGHKWDEGKVNSSSGCGAGVKTYTCTVCGKTKTEKVSGTHDFGDWVYDKYEDEYGFGHNKHRTCKKCGYVETVTYAKHYCDNIVTWQENGVNYSNRETVPATCTHEGYTKITCTICGYVTYSNRHPINANSHIHVTETKKKLTDRTEYTDVAYYIAHKCTDCGTEWITYDYTDIDHVYDAMFSKMRPQIIGSKTFYFTWLRCGYTTTPTLEHPDWQHVVRNQIYDSDGYLIRWREYWVDPRDGVRYHHDFDISNGYESFIRQYCGNNDTCDFLLSDCRCLFLAYDRDYIYIYGWREGGC